MFEKYLYLKKTTTTKKKKKTDFSTCECAPENKILSSPSTELHWGVSEIFF